MRASYPIEGSDLPEGILWVVNSPEPLAVTDDQAWVSFGSGRLVLTEDRGSTRCMVRLDYEDVHVHLEVTNRDLEWLLRVAESLIALR